MAQLVKEFFEMAGTIRRDGNMYEYFMDPFNSLDWLRFSLFFSAVYIRIALMIDTSRDFSLDTTEYIDTERVVYLYRTFDLITSFVTLCSLLSTIQYFALSERTNMLKSTLAKAGKTMKTFIFVFLMFFLIYSLLGWYLLGPYLEMFSTYLKSIYTSFDMMNANIPFEFLIPVAERRPLAMLSIALYYYTFIAIHYFILLNVIIAIVIDAYLEVQETRESEVVKKFRSNLGSLEHDLIAIVHRHIVLTWLIIKARLNPMSLITGKTHVFIEWDDDTWLDILEEVIEVRQRKGLPSRGTTLLTLTREIQALPHKHRTIAERIANSTRSAYLTKSHTHSSPERTNPRTVRVREVVETAKLEKVHVDSTFRQVRARFYQRPYWQSPANLAEPFEETAQPPQQTWKEVTLERISELIERVSRRMHATSQGVRGAEHALSKVVA